MPSRLLFMGLFTTAKIAKRALLPPRIFVIHVVSMMAATAANMRVWAFVLSGFHGFNYAYV